MPVGQVISKVKTGKKRLRISKKGHGFHTDLDGSEIVRSKSEKEFISRASPVLALVTGALCGKKEPVTVMRVAEESYADMLNRFIRDLSRNLENAEVTVLELKPDEMSDNKPAQIQASSVEDKKIFDGVRLYGSSLKGISSNVDNAKHLSDILLRTKFPKTMWGAKEVEKRMGAIRSDMESLTGDLERMEASAERSDLDARRLLSVLKSRMSSGRPGKDVASDPAISLSRNHVAIKEVIAALLQALYGLYNIDRVFKRYTGYPTTWFFNSSIFYDFLYEFETMVENMVRMAVMEMSVMRPLSAWKVKITGE